MSGTAATTLLAAGLASPGETLACLGLGTLGALLPDLDADSSAPVRVSFNAAASALAFATMFLLAGRFPSLAELLVVWVATFLVARALLFALLTRISAHRGMLHSLPAAALFGLLTTVAAHRGLDASAQLAWLLGAFVGGGYLAHLLLDEAHAINLFGARTRRSVGSALKLWSRRGLTATVTIYLAVAGALLIAPSPASLLRALEEDGIIERIDDHLWPRAGWFRAREVGRQA